MTVSSYFGKSLTIVRPIPSTNRTSLSYSNGDFVMKPKRQLATAFAMMFVIGVATSSLSAQQQGTTRRDDSLTRPPVSPYLDLLRRDTGALPAYQAFVRPRLDFQQRQSIQSRAIRQLQQQTTANAQSINRIRPTGQGGYFNNYLHYYQMGSGRR